MDEVEALHSKLRAQLGVKAGVERALMPTLRQFVQRCPLLRALCYHRKALLANHSYCRRHFSRLECRKDVEVCELNVQSWEENVFSQFSSPVQCKRCKSCSVSSLDTLKISRPAVVFVKLNTTTGLADSSRSKHPAIIPFDGRVQLPLLDSQESYRVCGAVLLGSRHATAVFLDLDDQCLVYDGMLESGFAVPFEGSFREVNRRIVQNLSSGGIVLLVLANGRTSNAARPQMPRIEPAVTRMPQKAFDVDMQVTFSGNRFVSWNNNSCALDAVLFSWLVTIQPSWKTEVAGELRDFLRPPKLSSSWLLQDGEAPLQLALLLVAIREDSVSDAEMHRDRLCAEMRKTLIKAHESNTTVDCQELWSLLAGTSLPAIGIQSTVDVETSGEGFCGKRLTIQTTMQRLPSLMVSASECMEILDRPDWLKVAMNNPLEIQTCGQCGSINCFNKNQFRTTQSLPMLVYQICWPALDEDHMKKVLKNMRIPSTIEVGFYSNYLNYALPW